VNLREHLEGIYRDHGKLTPHLVVEEARPIDSPLHSRFEWDDAVAAEAYRIDQARELIRSVRITYASGIENHHVRAFLSVHRTDSNSYVPTEEVVADPLLYAIAVRDMERDWNEFRARYEHLKEFHDLDYPQTG